ncbi:MAG: hypothetical protein OER88_12105 [Planctomycetota bacterium]|nr:hypothetical protein [Planctomycetota bacterium]
MDRSFLSDSAVVAAARDFVCVRLATYESADEAKFMTSIFRGRTGQLENTVFTILAPDGKSTLLRPARSPKHTMGSAARLAESMNGIAKRYPSRKPVQALPYAADLRRGLNIASCDLQPLVVVVASTPQKRKAIEAMLTPLAWSDAYRGVYGYATATPKELDPLSGAQNTDGVLVVFPDSFGVKGAVVARATGTDKKTLAATLAKGVKTFKPKTKDSHAQIQEARRQNLVWETEIPVTDPHGPGRRR